jgi:hypothetical protein
MRVSARELVLKPMAVPPGLFLFGVHTTIADPVVDEFLNTESVPTRLLRTA